MLTMKCRFKIEVHSEWSGTSGRPKTRRLREYLDMYRREPQQEHLGQHHLHGSPIPVPVYCILNSIKPTLRPACCQMMDAVRSSQAQVITAVTILGNDDWACGAA